jgi:hypothetical protein
MGSTMAPGTYHIKKMSASGIEMARIASFTSAEFGGVQGTANSDPMKRPKLPMSNIELVQDQFLQVDFVPSNTTTEHSTSAAYVATVKIPFRALDLATGVVARNDFVTNGGMTAGYPAEYTFTAIRTYLNSQVWTAGITYPIFKWKIPAGVKIRLGHQPISSGDYTASTIYLQFDITTS